MCAFIVNYRQPGGNGTTAPVEDFDRKIKYD